MISKYSTIRSATARVSHAIRTGLLRAPYLFQCVDCGEPATEYDHRDYAKPLDVQPVCHSCNQLRGPGLNNEPKPKKQKELSAVQRELHKAIDYFCGQTYLAKKLGVRQPVVGNWLLRQSVPPQHALRIEELTRGKVKARALCPRVFGRKQ